MHTHRRTFLKILSAAPLVACSGGSGEPASFDDVSAGNVSDTSEGTLAVISGAPAILARDAGGLYAMTITCTHAGCDVAPSNNSTLYCSCHGSEFDSNGKVLKGPAGSPLVHFAVSLDAGGNITVHGKQQVDASARAAVS